MKLYEIPIPELETSVRYRVLGTDETDALLLEYGDSGDDQFKRAVLEAVIYNLKTDVTTSLRRLPKEKATKELNALYNGCLMINPGLDVESWLTIAQAPQLVSLHASQVMKARGRLDAGPRRGRGRKITKQKFLNLERHLKTKIIGQDEAIADVVNALKRAQVGLNDEQRPLGVFLLAGASGVGKSLLAKEVNAYLYGDSELVRIDCGEYQMKHENAKLLGSPPGYLGYDDGTKWIKALTENPQAVILLDEVEKAHSDLWNTFLRVFDEGIMTDNTGKTLNLQETLIFMTTNLGNEELVRTAQAADVGFARRDTSAPKRETVIKSTQKAIQDYFKPELLNRLDKVITFNHLTDDDYFKIAELELSIVQLKLEKRGFIFTYDSSVLEAMVRDGVSHVQGARGLAQLRRDRIENLLAEQMLNSRFTRGTAFRLIYDANDYQVLVRRPVVKQRLPKTASSSKPRVVTPA